MKSRDKRRRNKARREATRTDKSRRDAKVNIYPLVDDRDRPDLRFGQKEA